MQGIRRPEQRTPAPGLRPAYQEREHPLETCLKLQKFRSLSKRLFRQAPVFILVIPLVFQGFAGYRRVLRVHHRITCRVKRPFSAVY